MVFSIGDILNQWQSAGIFSYLLPALVIFAVVFGILNKSKVLGDDRKIHVIVALAISLLALQQDLIPRYFAPLFSKLGVGVAVILVLLILVGLFIGEEAGEHYREYWYWGFGAVGFIIFVVIVSQTFNEVGYGSYGFYADNVGWIVGGVLVVGVIIAIAAAGSGDNDSKKNKDKD